MVSKVKWDFLFPRFPVPLLDLLQAVTFGLTHKKDDHNSRRQTTSGKEIVRAKRRLIKQHWCHESDDVVDSLPIRYVSMLLSNKYLKTSLTQFELCARLEALLLVRLGMLSTTHVRKPMAQVRLNEMAKR